MTVSETINSYSDVPVDVDAGVLRQKFIPDIDVEKVDAKYNVRPFPNAGKTKENLKILTLDSLDFSKYQDGPEGLQSRLELAAKLEKAITTIGFFNIINFGFSDAEYDRLASISQAILELPQEDKLKYRSGALRSDEEDRSRSLGAERGFGFKPKGYWNINAKVRDNIEFYNIKDVVHDSQLFDEKKNYPEIAKAHLPEIGNYYRFLHFNVLRKLCTLCDIILKLPEGTLWETHFKVYKDDLVNSGGGWARLMIYHGLKPDEYKLTNNTQLRGHSDSPGFTFIKGFAEIFGLQIRDYYSGEWIYVQPIKEALCVNVGDAMEFITGGYFKSSIHRVVAPPDDQKGFKRMMAIYFCDPAFSSVLDPEHLQSPKLNELNITKPDEWERITHDVWSNEKGRLFGQKKVNSVQGDEPRAVKMFGRLAERWHQVDLQQQIKI
ncbi:Clavaminate synthase-like protein [Ascoidea rubescens DSM 1968]|uniref:Clavaminate synthase-like protein n=1 Tax=Ascoidea rubescens DSM 1968 TaxID=1344418 RepID=A0A1D2VP85_9ASCO|nr:Clavaminate synthase-like protein [Ascoidea rubescens DSM 1968]ODV63420.1 Clavaminate synthase-like protein [Ascoidea rubescens DSM 1968]